MWVLFCCSAYENTGFPTLFVEDALPSSVYVCVYKTCPWLYVAVVVGFFSWFLLSHMNTNRNIDTIVTLCCWIMMLCRLCIPNTFVVLMWSLAVLPGNLRTVDLRLASHSYFCQLSGGWQVSLTMPCSHLFFLTFWCFFSFLTFAKPTRTRQTLYHQTMSPPS